VSTSAGQKKEDGKQSVVKVGGGRVLVSGRSWWGGGGVKKSGKEKAIKGEQNTRHERIFR